MNMIQVSPKIIDKNDHDEYEFRAPLLTLRLITLMIVVVLLTLHVRSMRVFRWEHSVTGGILVTYTMSMLGLALCAGAQRCGGLALQVSKILSSCSTDLSVIQFDDGNVFIIFVCRI